jgi:tRNA (cmo5U34)-methyltransferase
MIGVLHHLDSPQQQQSLLRQVGQRLSPGGLLIAGSHVGPLSDPLRRGAWEERWREYGASEDEMQSRREKVDQLVALQPATFDRWLSESGFGHRERIFSSLFFEVWAAQAGSTRVGTTAT